MQIRRLLKGLAIAVPVACLGACTTPMPADSTARLCAPMDSNTRACADRPLAADVLARQTAPPAAPPVPVAEVRTMPIDIPGAPVAAQPPGKTTRIGLMLPLRSSSLGGPAEAVRAGFMAAYERDRDGFIVNIVETGDGPDDALDAYMSASKQNDMIVGPLTRSAVDAVAGSGAVSVPTIALNHFESSTMQRSLPPNMLAIGLSNEDEARQVAQWAAAEHPRSAALILSGSNPWQRRLAAAFAARWRALGGTSQLVELNAASGYLVEADINALGTRLQNAPPALMFAALDAAQLRQVRSNLGPAMPLYGTSSVNPGLDRSAAAVELDGVRLLDMPWQLDPDHPVVMSYPRRSNSGGVADLDRLYALGIDAFRIARELALRPGTPFQMDGVTGRVSVRFGQGAPGFERIASGAVYQGSAFKLLDKRP